MPSATALPAAILETILIRLAALFLVGAAGDLAAARHAATQMLATYGAETEDELRLAANIISFGFHALEALAQAAAADLPISRILRLRGSAVSLSRQSHKAERRLDQLQKARRRGVILKPDVSHGQAEPKIAKAFDVIEDTRKVTVIANASGISWTQAYEQRRREARIGASLKRAEARSATQATVATSGSAAAAAYLPATRDG